MGISTDGVIAFGVTCQEDQEFPWDGEPWGGDFEEWWIAEQGSPAPVHLENYCSGDGPMWAIVVPGVGVRCARGYPESFDPAALTVTADQVEQLVAFLRKYKIPHDSNPRWLLMSYWG